MQINYLGILRSTAILAVFLGLFSCGIKQETPSTIKQYLHEGWQFKSQSDSLFHSAKVPGNNYSDLMEAGLIPDPFYADNETATQWVDEQNWIYQLHFTPEPSLFDHDSLYLVMQGLDSYADVTLNGILLISTDNMFREYRVAIDSVLKKDENLLQVLFHSPLAINKEKASTLPYQLPDSRVLTRKAPYQLGWDWGPQLVCSGIWQPIYLEAASDFIIKKLNISTLEINSQLAKMTARIQIQVLQPGMVDFQLQNQEEGISFTFKKELGAGLQEVQYEFDVKKPRLWWPAGYGAQELYHFNLKAHSSGTVAESSCTAGIRQCELIQEKDEIGSSFYFKINGLPIFAKGANYIPQDNLLNRVDSLRYEKLFERTCDANMNMLRVWGGGIYENDYFYELADAKGILIWQDFMYACAMYPGDDAFLENARQEAEYQVTRLSSHPSVVLWCGNNESDNGWKDWGWQKQYAYSASDSSKIYQDYLKLFEGILPAAVNQFALGTAYHPSSPTFGWGHPESLTQGDSHYWGIWWGMEDFEKYNEKTGRFMSEYGFQGAPSLELLREYIPDSHLQVYDPVLLAHQKHPTGNQTIDSYVKRYMPKPESFEEWIYVSQVLQAYGMEAGIRYHRMKKPYCMGTLYWQLNDCWPVISWSGLDYKYNKKALHYRAKEAFEQVMPWVKPDGNEWMIGLNSDSVKSIEGRLIVQKVNTSGDVTLLKDSALVLDALSNKEIIRFSESELSVDKQKDFLMLSFKPVDSSQSYDYVHYFVRPLDLQLKPSKNHLNMQIREGKIILRSDILIKNIYIYSTRRILNTDQNYFDMLPGQEYLISPDCQDLQINELAYRCLNDVGKN